jgi:hypothetical protein
MHEPNLSLRRTKAAMIYKATGNLRAIQILLGHTKIENTVRYPGVDIEDALELASGAYRDLTVCGPAPSGAVAVGLGANRPVRTIPSGCAPTTVVKTPGLSF